MVVLVALMGAAWASQPKDPPTEQAGPRATPEPAGSRSQSRLETTFRGHRLSYAEVDGWAVHAGDMVLGRADDMLPLPPRPGAKAEPVLPGLAPRALSAADARYLWPDGIVPYVIDANVAGDQRRNVLAAIQHWNEKTVVKLLPRVAQPNYVRFLPVSLGACRSIVGMRGGEQHVSLPPQGCSAGTLVHEIGHAVGLWHEHQRGDRDQYVMVLHENLNKRSHNDYSPDHPHAGPYDFASVMHYGRLSADSTTGGNLFETIPPGMPLPAGHLSAGDIDGIARLYGHVPQATTLSTNPPGLALIVDGVRITTPATVRWTAGSKHSLEVPLAQMQHGARYLFGRWNDGGQRRRTVTASPDVTWLEANLIEQYRVGTAVEPRGAGSVTLSPPSPDAFYTVGTELQAAATPASRGRYRFLEWGGVLWGQHGRANNPAAWRVNQSDKTFQARFTTSPPLRVEANIDAFRLQVRGYYEGTVWTYAPAAFRTDVGRSQIFLGVEPLARPLRGGLMRYRFERWSDGGSATRAVRLPRTGGVVTAQFATEYPLSTAASKPNAGSVSVNPPSNDRYYREGSRVSLTAQPAPSWEFERWAGDTAGQTPSTTVLMDRPLHAEAVFTQTSELKPGNPVNLVLPSTNYNFMVYRRKDGYRVRTADDAAELSIRLDSSSPGVEVGLAVTAASESLTWAMGDDGKTPIFDADFQSRSDTGSQTIVITPESDPPLDPGSTYYVSVLVFAPFKEVRGSLRTALKKTPVPRPSATASPRAFTFVSSSGRDSPPQTFRLTNTGRGPLQYAISSDQRWLSVSRASGTLASGTGTEVEIQVNAAGVRPDTHQGKLKIAVPGRGSAAPVELATIPVTFVALPR